MKCYRKEDLKKIGYYRTEEQLQERLKEIECEAICVGEEDLHKTCERLEKKFPLSNISIWGRREGRGMWERNIVLTYSEYNDSILKGEYIVFSNLPNVVFTYKTLEKMKDIYVLESDVKDFVHKCALKVEELFHVTKKNIKVIATYDGFYNGVAEDVVLPDWLKRRIQDCSVVVKRKKFGQSMAKLRIFEEIYLLFTDATNGRNVKINFGDYVALLEDGSLKVFSEELVDKFYLEK